ncbi:hypothetical protein FHW75_003436 [Pseudomonas sp. OG7]|jgi:hypothetical protein|nr:hypothetical protein [Pseudomonas sp. OG7]
MSQGQVDGLLYPSAVYSVTGSMDGCNIVLFQGRSIQIEAIRHQAVSLAVLQNGETVVEFLYSLGVALE